MQLGSRLIMGTGGAPSLDGLEEALLASGTELTTVAMRRFDAEAGSLFQLLLDHITGCPTPPAASPPGTPC